MPDFDDVIALTAHLPEVSESLSYGTPSLRVRGKSFCRLWGDRDFHKADVSDSDVLVVFCDLGAKEALLAESDGSVFTAAHYDNYGAVLVRLGDVKKSELKRLLLESYLLKAPPALRRQVRGL